MSMTHRAVVRLADEHAAGCIAKVAAGHGDPAELDRLAVSCAALAEVAGGAVGQRWSQLAERLHGDALMARSALAGSDLDNTQQSA